jgi:hypothetical protein
MDNWLQLIRALGTGIAIGQATKRNFLNPNPDSMHLKGNRRTPK